MADDEEEWAEAPFLSLGSVHALTEGSNDPPVAILLVPDPEQRRGWREHYVEAEEPERSRIGFRGKGG